MRTHRLARTVMATLAASACVAVLAGCGGREPDRGGTFFGPSHKLGDGTAKTYVTVDGAGNPTEVGLRLTETALNGLPAEELTPAGMVMLDFPDQAASTAFDHVMINWNPRGHVPPGIFDEPHFDTHFYMTDMSSVMAINPSDPNFATRGANIPQPQFVPQDFVAVPDGVVPAMGAHFVDTTEPLVPGQYDFKETVINGSWDGQYTFIEPMITREYLLTKPTLREDLKLPQAYQKSGYFPTNYTIGFDDQAKEYTISLGGLTMRNAS
jgi:hypothetical protein